ncbi:MAG: translocation and assembly module TamB [Pseudohongiellaceae bacterium]
MSDIAAHSRWRKPALALLALVTTVLMLLGIVSFLLSSQAGSSWVLGQLIRAINSDPSLSLSFDEVQGSLLRGVSFSEIELRSGSDKYSAARLTTQWNPYSLLSGSFYLSRMEVTELRVELISVVNESSTTGEQLPEEDLLPIALQIAELRISGIEVSNNGAIYVIESVDLSARLQGRELDIEELVLVAPDFSVSGDLVLVLTESLPLQARLRWGYQDFSIGPYDTWEGNIELEGDLNAINLVNQLDIPFTIRSSGSFNPGIFDNSLSLNLRHVVPEWLLPFEPAELNVLRNATLVTSGDFSRLALTLEGELDNSSLPSVLLNSTATLSGSSLVLESYRFSTSSGVIEGTSNIDWGNGVKFFGNYELAESNPTSYSELPIAVDLSDVSIQGSFDFEVIDSSPVGEISIRSMSGQLGNYPVQGQGSIDVLNDGFQFRGVELSTQNNSLKLDGLVSGDLNLNWELSAPQLQEIFAELRGELAGSGYVGGSFPDLNLQGSLTGLEVGYGLLSTDRIELSFAQSNAQFQTGIQIGNFSYVTESIDEEISNINLRIDGSQAEHEIVASADTNYGEIALALRGGVVSLVDRQWAGSMLNSSATSSLGNWSTREASNLTLGLNSINLGGTCWYQLDSSLCLSTQSQANSTLLISGELGNYPLTAFNVTTESTVLTNVQAFPFLQLSPRVFASGLLAGDVLLTLEPGQTPKIELGLRVDDASVEIVPLRVTDEEEFLDEEEIDHEIYLVDNFELIGQFDSGTWNTSLNSSFRRENIEESEEGLTGRALANLSISPQRGLSGQLNIGIEDLSWIEALLPELSDIAGALTGEVDIGGSIDEPEFTGNLAVENASFSIDRLGISLTEVSSEINSANVGMANFSGGAKSGEGTLNVSGAVLNPLSSARSITATVSGEQFQFSNLPDIRLDLSPEISLLADQENIDIQGVLSIPTLALVLRELPETAIDVSRDVVIVSYPEDRPDLQRSSLSNESTLFDIPITGKLNIALGESVEFIGFGLTTILGGSLDIEQTLDGSNRTYGELSIVEGNYEMYRQSLDIRQGKLLFFGAYDNPAIDIRASRIVENQTVGVLMNGTLKSMKSQLYSTPALPDSEIISMLVTGRKFSQIGAQDSDALLGAVARLGIDRTQGLTNQIRDKLGLDTLAIENTGDINNSVLMIGKNLTPELFVRYGVGLFDSQPKVAVDYLLSERLKLQAESGEFQSVDLIYTVEH